MEKGVKGFDSGQKKKIDEGNVPITREFIMKSYHQSSVMLLAQKTRLNRRRVDRRVNLLEKSGIIRRHKVKNEDNIPTTPKWKSYEFGVKGLELDSKTGKWKEVQVSEDFIKCVQVNRLIAEYQKTGDPKILEELKKKPDIEEIFHIRKWLKDKELQAKRDKI